MKFKKILCGVTAALMLGSLSAVTASADGQTATVKKLLSVNLSDIDGARNGSYYGNGIFGYDNADDPNIENDVDGIIRIDLEKWRETGKFDYSDVETDFDMTDVVPSFSAGDGWQNGIKYVWFSYPEKELAVKLDTDNNKMTAAYSFENGCVICDGYAFTAKYDKTSLKYAVYDPNGNKTENTIVFADNEKDWWHSQCGACEDARVTDKYIAYILGANNKRGFGAFDGCDLKVYGVKRDGSCDVVYSNEGTIPGGVYGIGDLHSGANCASWVEFLPPATSTAHIYSADDGKLYEFNVPYCLGSDRHTGIPFAGLQGRLYGTKGVGYFMCKDSEGKVEDEAYALVDLAKADGVSDSYKSMGTLDGEIYLVEGFDGKWGYIDSNGKELAFFDDASEFIGDYAPVVSNGKGYLIDQSMKQISDTVSAKECRTADDGLYYFYTDSDTLLVTYSNETVSAPETSEPASTTDGYIEPASGTPSTSASEPVADSNPSTGIALSFFPIAAALSAVIAIKKKK